MKRKRSLIKMSRQLVILLWHSKLLTKTTKSLTVREGLAILWYAHAIGLKWYFNNILINFFFNKMEKCWVWESWLSQTCSGPQPASLNQRPRWPSGPALYSPRYYVMTSAAFQIVPEVETCKRCCNLRHQIVTAQKFFHAFPCPVPCGTHSLGFSCLQHNPCISPVFTTRKQWSGHRLLLRTSIK